MMIQTNENKLIDWLRLTRTPRIGPNTFWQFMRHYGAADRVIAALQTLDGLAPQRVLSADDVEKEIVQHQKKGLVLLPAFSPLFPESLKRLSDCPPVLSVWGDPACLGQSQMVAIVGARNASLMGRQFAEKLARDLGKNGWTIVSGLARGIDRHAHLGSLKTGTIAVVAGGVDVVYPPEHKDLYGLIAQHGAVVSEMPLSTHPGATHFPRRNRLISGFSRAVCVIEAAPRSGSLITARFALEQNKELFAVPGSPYDPRCRGTNNLIKNGAHVLQEVQDIYDVLGMPKVCLEEIVYDFDHTPAYSDQNKVELREKLLTDLSTTPISIDRLVESHPYSVQEIMVALLECEVAGLIYRTDNRMVARVYNA